MQQLEVTSPINRAYQSNENPYDFNKAKYIPGQLHIGLEDENINDDELGPTLVFTISIDKYGNETYIEGELSKHEIYAIYDFLGRFLSKNNL